MKNKHTDTDELWVMAISKDGQKVWVDLNGIVRGQYPMLKITAFEPEPVLKSKEKEQNA